MKDLPTDLDAVVVGAGPAGCSAAAVLAEHGRRVALLDRGHRGRYSVGESLIPFCWDALDRLGLIDRIDASDFKVRKNSVQFAGTSGSLSKPFYFFEHTDHPRAKTWQVVRSDFDGLLSRNAEQKGAQLIEGALVRELIEEGDRVAGVRGTLEDGGDFELRAPVTIDATGRSALAQTRFGWRVPDPCLKKMAIWTYYEGARRQDGVDEGNTTIAYLPRKGWFWYIPLPGDRVSVGVVADKDYLFSDTKEPGEIFEREVEVQRWIAEQLSTGRRVADFRVTSDFSYRSEQHAADGLVLCGDAFSFLDPVFSSGVFFALTSGVMAGDAVHAALTAGDTSRERFEEYGRRFRRKMEPMRQLVYAFYDPSFNFGEFLEQHPEYRSQLTDCLIGDVDQDYAPFFDAVTQFAEASR